MPGSNITMGFFLADHAARTNGDRVCPIGWQPKKEGAFKMEKCNLEEKYINELRKKLNSKNPDLVREALKEPCFIPTEKTDHSQTNDVGDVDRQLAELAWYIIPSEESVVNNDNLRKHIPEIRKLSKANKEKLVQILILPDEEIKDKAFSYHRATNDPYIPSGWKDEFGPVS